MNRCCRELLRCSLVVVAISTLLAGCQRGPGYDFTNLEGSVTVAGRPLTEGSVRFLPRAAGQGSPVGAEIHDGKYAVQHVPLGELDVQFVAIRKTERLPDDANGMQQWAIENLIPEAAREGQVIKVERGQSRCDFRL
jgi:hypothetical protein